MSEKKGDDKKHPYMYIVQPDFSPPVANMQKYFHAKVKPEQEEKKQDDSEVLDQIRIVESEELDKEIEESNVNNKENDDSEVVEVSTSIEEVEDKTEQKPKEASARIESQTAIEQPKKKPRKFSEMTKEELLEYLVKLPPALPKPTCFIVMNGEELNGQILKRKGNMYVIKFIWDDRSKIVNVPFDEIEEIVVENL